jgi:hypothetical protein
MLVTLLGGLYLASVIWKGWIPFDDGMLAQTAQRVLEGQLPHRDFDDVYTGGLALLHAGAFAVGGSSLATLRTTLLLVTTLSIPVWFYLASRLTRGHIAAGLVTLTALVWSIPNYPAAMPSWYNLILAIIAAASMVRYLDTENGRWVFVAGACSGVSMIIKIVGFYLTAALALFIAFRSRDNAAEHERPSAKCARIERVLSIWVACVLTVAPFLLIAPRLDAEWALELALPTSLVSGAILWRLIAAPVARSRSGERHVMRDYALLIAGTLVPLAAFSTLYFRVHAFDALLRGVFVAPQRRFSVPSMHTSGGPPWT